MDLATLQTNLTTWVETYAGVPCEWGKLPQKIHNSPFALVYLGEISKAGHDERIQTYDEATDTTSVRVVGVRRLTLQVSFRAFNQNLGSSARQYAETFRAAMHSQSSFDDLNAANVALIDTAGLIDSDYTWSGRTVSQCDMSVYFALRASTADPNHDGSYIKNVNVYSASYIVGEDGQPVLDEEGNPISTESTLAVEVTSP